jgi:hypothetical protein
MSECKVGPTFQSVAKLEQNGGGATRVGLGGGAENLFQGGALEVKKVISTKFQNFCGCICTHMLQGSFATEFSE